MTGNLIIAQSGGPTAVINASLAGVIQSAQESRHIGKIIGAVNGTHGMLHENLVDLGHEDPRVVERLRETPGAALGTNRLRLKQEHFGRILDVFRSHQIRFLCLIGGNDSMQTASQLARAAGESGYELAVMGIPKTVDNDLEQTDHCPGYGSAARFVAVTVRDTGIDSRSGALSTPVKIVEIMGRHAGWLTAASALAREGRQNVAPHLIYLPERPFSLESFLRDIEEAHRRFGYVVIALSEGVRDPSGEFHGTMTTHVDAFGHRQLGGVSAILANEVTNKLGLKARFEKPDTMQRSSSALASTADQQEAYAVGREAVRAMLAGQSGFMVTLKRVSQVPYQCSTGLVELEKVAGAEKHLPEDFVAANGHDVTPAFLDYARPLIGDPLPEVADLAMYPLDRQLPPWKG